MVGRNTGNEGQQGITKKKRKITASWKSPM